MNKRDVWECLTEVVDPELMINIVDLGLVYDIRLHGEEMVEVEFTLTYPGCPAADIIAEDITETLRSRLGFKTVKTSVVWSPTWTPEMMKEEIRVGFGYPI